MLLKKAYEGLNDNGYIVVFEPFINNERTHVVRLFNSLLMRLVMRGNEVTHEFFEGLLKEAGFTDIQKFNLDLVHDAFVARKIKQ